MMRIVFVYIIVSFATGIAFSVVQQFSSVNRFDSKETCPKVKAIRNFDLSSMMGFWYVVQYYASSEELPEYSCMRSLFSFSAEDQHVTMNFTYMYSDDPLHEQLQGNITWTIPNFDLPAHWIHTEDIYEGIYNTYVIDSDYKSWALLMHCAEKSKSPRYLSALLLSRDKSVEANVITFLREKLPPYDIDLTFMFPIKQHDCEDFNASFNMESAVKYSIENKKLRKNVMKIIPVT